MRGAARQKLMLACPAAGTVMCAVQEHYGQESAESIGKVKDVYKQLELESIFQAYEKDSYDSLTALIKKQQQLPEDVFLLLLKKIYKRSK